MMMVQQSSELPPAQPIYILRGHVAQIHALHFYNDNTRLLSGDAEGWVVVWDLATKRPAAVWRPHNSTILGLRNWGSNKIITHGRDGKLCVWQLTRADEDTFSKELPMNDLEQDRKAPWLLHSLHVHALNFCSFASCKRRDTVASADDDCIIIAVSGVQDGSIHLTALPSEQRLATIPPPAGVKTGMLMAIGLHSPDLEQPPLVFAGYESGHAAVWQHDTGGRWQSIYVQKAHSQPILSLDVAHELRCFFTSSADASLARHALEGVSAKLQIFQTKHAGQQSLQVRSDERIIATAGWDGRMRVYSTKTMKERAVLKWHREGCYACAFAIIHTQAEEPEQATHITVAERRLQDAKDAHWLAAGSKDGKVSLWQVY